MVLDIVLPALGLLAIGVVAPYLWARVLPEGVRPLLLNGALSVATCILAAAVLRIVIWDLPGWGAILRWIGLTALVWLPAVVLALAQQPSRWQEEEW